MEDFKMKAFMDKDFLLETETARKLFHDYAEKTPILDYHCHINANYVPAGDDWVLSPYAWG